MKKISVLFVFIMLSISSIAQTDNWYFSFTMGGSWPTGTFGQSDNNTKTSGYAQKGFAIMLDGTYPLSNHWGLKGLVYINTNTVDNPRMESMIKNRIDQSVNITNSSYLSYTSNPWMWNALLVGPVFTVPVGRFYWDLQLLGGLNLTYLPQQKLQYNDPQNKWYYTDKNTTSTDLSWGVLGGTAFRFPISERLNLKVGLDYYISAARIKYQQTRISQQAESVLTEILGSGNDLIPIKMISGTIGFVYYLN